MYDADTVWNKPDEELLLKFALPLIQETLKRKVKSPSIQNMDMNLVIP